MKTMKDWPGHAVTMYRALKLPNGKVVATDPEYLTATCVAARTSDQFYVLLGQGWIAGHPQDALDAFEASEQVVSNEATYRAADDQKMSDKAKAEAEAYEQSTPLHTPEIPEQVKKPRGRPKKVS